MPDKSSSNVKIYDRPERKGPTPLVLGIALVVVLLLGYVLYRTVFHPTVPPVKTQVGMVPNALTTSGFFPVGGALFQYR